MVTEVPVGRHDDAQGTHMSLGICRHGCEGLVSGQFFTRAYFIKVMEIAVGENGYHHEGNRCCARPTVTKQMCRDEMAETQHVEYKPEHQQIEHDDDP